MDEWMNERMRAIQNNSYGQRKPGKWVYKCFLGIYVSSIQIFMIWAIDVSKLNFAEIKRGRKGKNGEQWQYRGRETENGVK